MTYKGKEVIRMTPNKWDGKSRTMLVWDVFDDGSSSAPFFAFVIGFDGDKVVVKEQLTKFGSEYGWHTACAEEDRDF